MKTLRKSGVWFLGLMMRGITHDHQKEFEP
jgi:hypothetical protein